MTVHGNHIIECEERTINDALLFFLMIQKIKNRNRKKKTKKLVPNKNPT